ncbi:hypothetical protein ACWKWU_14005 [Chitinophaga lutea]
MSIRTSIKAWKLIIAAVMAAGAGLSWTPEHSVHGGQPADPPVRAIGSGRQLFIDDLLIDRIGGGASLRMHEPVARERVLEFGQPWEGSGSSFHSIFKDGDMYRMYYSAWDFTIKPGKVTDDSHPYMLCYAESKDGIHWRKPNLGICTFKGSKQNNIVMISGRLDSVYPDLGHPAVFKDENPDAPADARYKAIVRDYSPATGVRGLLAFKSADGLRWKLMHEKAVIDNDAFDSQNLAFWDEGRKEYRAYWRYMTPKYNRSIRTAVSKDFIHWTDRADLRYGNEPERQLYTNVVKTYYRAPEYLIGFPVRYTERGWSESMKALPDLENRKLRATGEERFGTALTESLLMASRDGVNFKRWPEAFLRPGIERTGTWHYGQQYIAWSMVETKSALEGAPNEISIYAVEGFWGTIKKGMDALRRYTIRLDGFVSLHAPMSGGELVTKPFTFSGKELVMNFSTSAAGGIQVELLDAAGKPIPGYTAEDCPEFFGDTVDRKVSWKNGADVSALQGKTVQLRFVLRDADIYSFRFQ